MKKFSSTMRESSRRTSRNGRIKRIVIIGSVGLFLLFLAPRVIGGVSSIVFAPIAHIETWFFESGSVLPSYFSDRSKLIEENNLLRKEISSKGGTEFTIKRLQSENSLLRGLSEDGYSTRVTAGVIGRPTVTPYDVIVLDKGESDGVVQFAPVYLGVDQAIGYVAEVYKSTSVVTLATTPGFESTVYIIGPNIYTTAKGIGGGVLQVSVPQGIPLSVNDLVVLPAFNSGVYGSIDVVNSISTEPEQRGYVTLDVPLQGMRFVSIGAVPLSPVSFEDAARIVERTKNKLTEIPVPKGVLVDVETASGTASSSDEVNVTDD